MQTVVHEKSWNRSVPSNSRFEALEPWQIAAEARRMQADEVARLIRAGAALVADTARRLLVAPVIRSYRRGRLINEMATLDDRSLADLGVSRFDIPFIADAAYPRWVELRKLRSALADLLGRALVAPVARWYKRRALAQRLAMMDDRMLADIGVGRFDIPNVVAKAYPEPAAGAKSLPAASGQYEVPVEQEAAHGLAANDPAAGKDGALAA